MLTTADGMGWYLYGITRSGRHAALLAEVDAARPGDAEPLDVVACDELAAVVRPVRLADCAQPVMKERASSAADLEALVRNHNRVIDGIHARQAILPAKFGMVYSNAADIASALLSAGDDLLLQLDRLEGRDEWALHLYAEPGVVRERVSGDDPDIRHLMDQCAAARPGRAYFLERELRNEIEAAIRRELMAIAQRAFERLSNHAVAAQATPADHVDDGAGELEILRAAFLVDREAADRFQADVRRVAEDARLRCETTGPWPPYSFAAQAGQEVM
jgi:hypothetical protein